MPFSLPDHELFRELLALGLPPEDFCVFGSGPLWIRGIREGHDLDVLARGAAWAKAKTLGEVRDGKIAGQTVRIGDIELFDAWGPGAWDVDAVIDGADTVGGVRFASLDNVIDWKRRMGRPKDLADLEAIGRYLIIGGR